MLLAHKIELRPTPEQREYLDKACGTKRHCFNQLLAHFSLPENKWSKEEAYQYYIKVIRKEFDWYTEVSSRVTRNAIDDLDNAFKHFFRRAKAKLKMQKLHFRITKQRQAALHDLSNTLTKTFDVITIEDLNVKGMVKNRKLSRAISDAGFGYLRQMIEYKAKLRNCTVVIANRFFPSSKTCSSCGIIKQNLTLADRVFSCECGFSGNRDFNAALNLDKYGRDTLQP